MKLLLVIHDFLPYHAGGSEIATYRLAKNLAARGVATHLCFTERRDDHEQYSLRTGEYEGLPFHEVVYNHRFEDFEDMYDDPRMLKVFLDILDETKPDVVHFEHLAFWGFGPVREARSRSIPTVLTLHDYYLLCPRGGLLMREDETLCPDRTADQCAGCMQEYPLRPEKYGADPNDFDRLAVFEPAVERRMQRVRELADAVTLFTAPSAFLRDRFWDHGFPRDRFEVTDNGYDKEGFEARSSEPAQVPIDIGYIGGLTPWKGVHVLLEACRELPEDGYRLHLHGDRTWFPDYIARLDELAEGLPIEFHGPFENREAGRILAGFDVTVVPSVWYENSPMTIHEAHLAGVPVVATNLGGMAEFIKPEINGLLFERGNSGDLAAKLRRLIEDPAEVDRLRAEMGYVKSSESEAEEWEQRYRSLL